MVTIRVGGGIEVIRSLWSRFQSPILWPTLYTPHTQRLMRLTHPRMLSSTAHRLGITSMQLTARKSSKEYRYPDGLKNIGGFPSITQW
jgi:hypothetical protein